MDGNKDSEKRAILIIDNDRAGAAKLKSLLNENAYRIYTAGTLKEALVITEEKRMNVVLLAMGRSGLDPERIIKRLKRGKDDFQIPVIVILESFVEDLVASALKAGAVDYLTCPVDSQELARRTGVYARLKEDHRSVTDRRKGLLKWLLPRLSGGFHSLVNTTELLEQRYEKVDRLGIGSFGEVWKVRDIEKDPPDIYVAKIPLSKKLNAKIEKEARILKKLAGHAGVPEVREVIEEKKKIALIQEFVFGKTLFEVIERELEEKEVESVMIQLIDVVAYAHDIGIIHRDIKPGNIMVKPDGAIKLLDFGAAKELKEKEMSNTVTGSRPFMSPEQIMGKSQKRSDVWALGVVMYVLYTGMFPFYHDVEKVLMDMILEVPPSPPSKFNEELDQEIERIILECLEKNPENRYPDAGALKEDITVSFPGYGEKILPLY
ncbi:MAG: protein kinase [Thermodesulfobacteriota bacterium]|nr:protein kinase [Thermodesulfobacteriota bacterium]